MILASPYYSNLWAIGNSAAWRRVARNARCWQDRTGSRSSGRRKSATDSAVKNASAHMSRDRIDLVCGTIRKRTVDGLLMTAELTLMDTMTLGFSQLLIR